HQWAVGFVPPGPPPLVPVEGAGSGDTLGFGAAMLFPSAVLAWSTFIACLEAPPAALELLLLTLLPERSRVRE
ncbi:hypothetical protein CRH12_11590, partial [Coxiella burnetii]